MRLQGLEGLGGAALLAASLMAGGCASPGPPKPPSLQLPEPVKDLSVLREGDEVRIDFTLPVHSTDGVPLKPPAVRATLCRGVEGAPCLAVPSEQNQELTVSQTDAAARKITCRDSLPEALRSGDPRALIY